MRLQSLTFFRPWSLSQPGSIAPGGQPLFLDAFRSGAENSMFQSDSGSVILWTLSNSSPPLSTLMFVGNLRSRIH